MKLSGTRLTRVSAVAAVAAGVLVGGISFAYADGGNDDNRQAPRTEIQGFIDVGHSISVGRCQLRVTTSVTPGPDGGATAMTELYPENNGDGCGRSGLLLQTNVSVVWGVQEGGAPASVRYPVNVTSYIGEGVVEVWVEACAAGHESYLEPRTSPYAFANEGCAKFMIDYDH